MGTSKIIYHSPEKYEGSPQNWQITIDDKGLVYVANNEGLLIFNGEKWKKYTQPNNTIARSIQISGNKEIFVGGQDELGVFSADDYGKLTYRSLVDKIPVEHRQFEDVWKVEYVDSTLYYRSQNSIYAIQNDVFSLIDKVGTSTMLKHIDGAIYYSDYDSGLKKYTKNNDCQVLPGCEALKSKVIVDICKGFENELLIFTNKSGIFSYSNNTLKPFQTNADSYLKQNEILNGSITQSNKLVIGTRLGGLYILHPDGKTEQVINKSNGLQSNAINSVAEDRWGNLWIATYYGVDQLTLASHINHFYPDGELEGAVYDVAFWKDKWWFATANGLYSLPFREYYDPFEKNEYQLVSSSVGQVWGLDIINDNLYMAHHNGAFKIHRNDVATPINELKGVWNYTLLAEDTMAIGTYNGLYICTNRDDMWPIEYKVKELEESSRVIMKDVDQNLWLSHPYRGIFKIFKNSKDEEYRVKKYTTADGFGIEKENYIQNLSNEPYITNKAGIFAYNKLEDRFFLDSMLVELIGSEQRVRKITGEKSKFWYITDTETGTIYSESTGFKDKYKKQRFPYSGKSYIGGFENLYPIDLNNQFLCTNKGISYHYSTWKEKNPELEIYISEVHLLNHDSIIVMDHYDQKKPIILNHDENALKIHFRTNGKAKEDLLGYRYKLKGLTDQWSEYQNIDSKEYNNLTHGTYHFHLEVKDLYGTTHKIVPLTISISPPWYETKTMVALYSGLAFLSLALLIFIPQKKYEKTTHELVVKQKETEKEMEELKRQKLQNEITYKNRELASNTLHLVQKNETLNKIRDEIEKLRKNVTDKSLSSQLKSILNTLKSDQRLEEDWDKFAIHFDEVHHDFIKKLKSKYPELSTNDHKLCAYLKMNLTTKEIAPLLNISVRGVEISRYRLRKKLKLEKSINLNEFMNQF